MQHSLVSVFTPSLMSAEDLEHIFVQREPLAQDLIRRIVDSTKGRGKEHSLLIGMRGMGKTHLVSLVYHRVKAMPELSDNLLIAWLREEEWGVDSWLDLVMRIFRAVAEDRDSADSGMAKDLLDQFYQDGFERAKGSATKFLRDLIGKRTLLLIIENMDDLFQGLGEQGQQEFRAFLQEYRCCTVLATTPAMFRGVESREMPFFGFFHPCYLESIEVDEAVKMLGQIASLNTVRDDHHDLAVFLQSAQGRARVRAIHHLAGGNPRVYTLFAQFMTRESLDDLVDAFMKMLDDLTPYYQARMKELSNQQRKIVELLVDRRQAVMVKDIAETCFIDQRAVASQLRELKKKGYVVANEVGRESFYELREVLMRFCMEVKKFRGRWVELIIDFLKVWYRPEQRLGMLEKFGDSKMMARDDLEQAFLSEDDPVAVVCMKEFYLSLKQQNKELAIKLTEEIYSLNFFSDIEYHRYTSLLRNEMYNEILVLLSSVKANNEREVQSLYVIFFIQGWMFLKERKWIEAVDSFDKALAIKPDKHEAWFNRGNALDELGKYKEAVLSYDRSISIRPERDKAWFYRGDSLRKLGRYQDAIASFDHAVAINSNDFKAWFNRGVFMNDLGNYEEAITSFDRALAIKPDHHQAWFDRGAFLYNLGKYEEAIESFNTAVTINPNDDEAWFNRGIFLYNLGNYNEAITSFDKSIDVNSSNRKVWYIRGISMIEVHKYHEAVESFGTAISLIPEDYDSWYSKGISFFHLGEYSESIASYNQAISIKPNHYFSWHQKGLVQFITGEYSSSLVTWSEAFEQYNKNHLSIFPHHNVTKLIQEFIEELIPRFIHPPIQQTLLIPLLTIYKESNVITELGAALVNTLHLIVAPTISDHTAAEWLSLWRTSSLGHEPAMELPLRLMSTAIEYKKDPSKRQRLWLNLPSEERPILDKALKFTD